MKTSNYSKKKKKKLKNLNKTCKEEIMIDREMKIMMHIKYFSFRILPGSKENL